MLLKRRETKKIKIGNTAIGGDTPVSIQSMTTTDTKNTGDTVAQILRLQDLGCEIIRIAVYDLDCARCIREIKRKIGIPLVADIHFDHQIAIEAIKQGADKIRINPGTIGGKQAVAEVVRAAKDYGIPIRVGVNSGSLEKDLMHKYGKPAAKALFESAERNAGLLAGMGFEDIVVSIKASSVPDCVEANRMFSEAYDYPLHLGVTEAGTYDAACIKASAALGALLLDGIGDTLRVSITGAPEEEVVLGKKILAFTGLHPRGLNVISCPTCARCRIDVYRFAKEITDKYRDIQKPVNVAVMGCSVNGPGEAKEADIGIAGGKTRSTLFIKGKIVKRVENADIYTVLTEYIDEIITQ